MSEIWWDLAGTDKQCECYGPGHWVHWIHHKKSAQEPGTIEPVTVTLGEDELFVLRGHDFLLRGWNHRPDLVRRALQRSGGSGLWRPRWKLLFVPTGTAIDGACNVFNLGPADELTPCRTINSPRPDLIPESWRTGPTPAWIGLDRGLKLASRYGPGRPRPTPHTTTTKGERL